MAVVEYIKEKIQHIDWISDKRVYDGCSRRRPDLLVDLGYQVIIIEIDENQHGEYDTTCENKRMMELSQDLQHRPMIIIRFNPDAYTSNNVNYTSCWAMNSKGITTIKKSKTKEWLERLQTLETQVKYWMDPSHITGKTVEKISLYYDS